MPWWVWVLVAFLLLTIEILSTTAHIGFFAIGAFLVAMLVGMKAGGPLWFQLLFFAISSVILLVFVRPVVVRKLGLSKIVVVDPPFDGQEAIVLEEMPVAGDGRAEMRGSTWSARNVGGTPLSPGQRCVVEKVVGLTLHVRAAS